MSRKNTHTHPRYGQVALLNKSKTSDGIDVAAIETDEGAFVVPFATLVPIAAIPAAPAEIQVPIDRRGPAIGRKCNDSDAVVKTYTLKK